MWIVSVGWRIVIVWEENVRKKIQDEIATPAFSRFAMTEKKIDSRFRGNDRKRSGNDRKR